MNIVILGATGSIGKNTVQVAKNMPGIKVAGVTANNNAESLLECARKTSAAVAVLADNESYETNRKLFSENNITLYGGAEGITKLVKDKEVDVIVNGLSGLAGLPPTLTALKENKKVAIANKEAIVMGWHLIEEEIKYKGQLIPVDSEHSAVFQLLNGEEIKNVSKIILTASGGAVYNHGDLNSVTPEECLKHPNWDMGEKITVDSATLMNKGLELIEAHNLFGIPYGKMGVYIHPQSVVHAMVQYCDGTVTAHMSKADMRIPIQYALTVPERHNAGYPKLSVEDIKELSFSEPDRKKFPALDLSVEAGKRGPAAAVALCAADEAAVESFLNGKIKFTQITEVIKMVLNDTGGKTAGSLKELENLYGEFTEQAYKEIDKIIK